MRGASFIYYGMLPSCLLYTSFGQTMATANVAEQVKLAKIIPPYTVTYGFVIAFVLIVVAHFMLKYTKAGYRISMTGMNSEFAQYGGVDVNGVRVKVMLLSGAVAGLCGAVEVMGVTWRYESGFSPDFGIEGILASLLGGNEPFGLLIGALFMGAVKAGSLVVERSAGIPRDVYKRQVWMSLLSAENGRSGKNFVCFLLRRIPAGTGGRGQSLSADRKKFRSALFTSGAQKKTDCQNRRSKPTICKGAYFRNL